MAVFKKGKDYYIDYRFQGRRLREKIGPNRRQAYRALDKRRIEIFENRFFDIRKESRISFFAMCRQYIDTYARPNKKSWDKDQTQLKTLMRYFGDVPLSKITRQMVEEYKAQRARQVSVATTNRELACLKTLYNCAIKWSKTDKNPVKGVKLYRENNQRTRFLEKGEIEALLSECSEWLKPIVQVALNSGLRLGEILSLRWDDIDFTRKLIHVRDSKSGEGRYIPMNQVLFQVLRDLPKHLDNPYLFPRRDGKPNNRFGHLRTAFNSAVKRAGIIDFTFHSLRHTFASHLVMAGVDLRTVGQLMGHKSGYKMTERYAHLSKQHEQDAVSKLNRLTGGGLNQEMDTQVDTRQIPGFDSVLNKLDLSLINQSIFKNGRVAESADAQDLKS